LHVAGGDLANISGVIGSNEFNLLIRALERTSGSDLLSAPKVTVLSGKTAEITVAQEFRYPQNFGDISADVGRGDSTSGSAGVAIAAGTPRDFTVRNLGVEMRVTPSVEEDNAISLRLEPAVTEFDGFIEYGGPSVAVASDTTVTVPSGFYQPLFSVRRIRTEVTIWDGATVVMGGLTREESVHVEDRVPVLGNIPILGRMFRSDGVRSQKRNLLIFVTANLVSPGGSHMRHQETEPRSSAISEERTNHKTQ
jgi:general secretion pathway protein D